MITTLENETIHDNISLFYDKSEGGEKYELKITAGELDVCDQSLSGNHLSNSEDCYTCHNINNFKNIINNVLEYNDDTDLYCGKPSKKKNEPTEQKDKNPHLAPTPNQFINDTSSMEHANSHIYELAKSIYNTLKSKNVQYDTLNDEIINAIPKGVSLIQTEYYDLYQLVLNLYRNNKETIAFNINKHPLIRLTSSLDSSEITHNFIKTISMISNTSKVNEFHKKVKFQSMSYNGIEDLENRTIKFSSENSVNAILFTFAACKLSYFENVAVVSSSDTLLLQLYNKKKIIKSDNFALAIARYSNIENEMKATSIVNIADNELRRVNAHLLFKKLVLNIRMGNFDMQDTKELESYILGLKNTDMLMQFDITEEENYLRSFFNIFGFNPILVRKNTLVNNVYPLKAVPFLPLNATQKLGTIDNPIKLASDMNLLINFDSLNNRIQITPSYKNTKYISESNMTGILSTLVNPATNSIYFNQMNTLTPTPLLINGTMIYAINRMTLDLLNRRGVGELSYIYNKDISLDAIDYDDFMTVNLQTFNLMAIVCYKLEDEQNFPSRYASTIGFTSYIKTNKDSYFCYDDCMNLTANNRELYEIRLLRNYYKYKVINDNEIDEDAFTSWKDTDSIAAKLKNDFRKGEYNYYTFIFTTEEVKEIAMKTGYLFIYSMDYNDYMVRKDPN